jgi:hypothetical protein
MSNVLIAFFVCVLLWSGTLAGQNTGTPKADNSKAAKKGSETYSASAAAKAQFMRETGYRNGRPGYVVVYRKPLVCGGTDDPSNLQWLTTAAAKAKDKADRKGCK